MSPQGNETSSTRSEIHTAREMDLTRVLGRDIEEEWRLESS